jgi:hypothetical protein
MSASTFTQALEQAALLARQRLPVLQHNRLSCAVAIVTSGGAIQRDDGSWDVVSQSEPGRQYHLNGVGCSCEDAHYRAPKGQCKHVLATLLTRKAVQLMQTPEPVPVVPEAVPEPYPDNDPGPEPPACPAPLPEARASINLKVLIGGHEVQVTLRDQTEAALLDRLHTLLKRSDVRPVPRLAPRTGGQWKKGR